MEHGEGVRHPAPLPSDDSVPSEDELQLHLTCEVAASAEEMRAVRTQLRKLLIEWQLEERVANAVLDVAHELLVNAHQHGAPQVRLTVQTGTNEIRIDVRDGSVAPARLLPYRPGLSEHGLGLQLVRQLSRQWGQTTDESGKSVWAVFSRRSPQTA
jgi:two-component sensor histidine kinase